MGSRQTHSREAEVADMVREYLQTLKKIIKNKNENEKEDQKERGRIGVWSRRRKKNPYFKEV